MEVKIKILQSEKNLSNEIRMEKMFQSENKNLMIIVIQLNIELKIIFSCSKEIFFVVKRRGL